MTTDTAPAFAQHVERFAEALTQAELDAPAVIEISVSHPDGPALLSAVDALIDRLWQGGIRRELCWLKGSEKRLSLKAFDAHGRLLERHVFPL